jgi:hypothetical protein
VRFELGRHPCHGEAKSFIFRIRFSSGFLIRRTCIRKGVTQASFSPVQSLNQFLNQRTQLRVVTFICHRSTKFAPIWLHTVSHDSPPTFGCECYGRIKHVSCHQVSDSVAYSSQRCECSFSLRFGNFAVQDSMYYPRSLELKLTTRERSTKFQNRKAVPTTARPIDKVTPQRSASNGFHYCLCD